MIKSFFVILAISLSVAFGLNYLPDRGISNKTRSNIEIEPLVPSYEFGKYSFFDIAITDNGKLWSVGYDGENPSLVRFSDNTGKTWNKLLISSEFTLLDSVYFIDSFNGWIAGNGNVFLHIMEVKVGRRQVLKHI